MISLTASDTAGTTATELVLINDEGKPTALLFGLIALELTFDCLVGYAAYRVFKTLKD